MPESRLKINGMIILIIGMIAVIGFFIWKTSRPERVVVIEKEQPIPVPYYLFTDDDNGTTTEVAIGGTVIIQLPDTLYGDPATLTDDGGSEISPKIETYSGYYVVSFSVPTTTSMKFTAHGIHSPDNFSLMFNATSSLK